MSKLPAFQFYPGDWRKDIGVQSLSYHDRGVWFEMLCLMHESERRGLLILNGVAMGDEVLARVLGLDKQILTTTITTLLTSGVASRDDETGAVMSRRMVKDEQLRKIRAEAGKLGGNPVLLNHTPNLPPNHRPEQNSTPSSSSSSSKEKEQIPSRGKRERTKTAIANQRHSVFKEAIGRYWDSKNPGIQMPWGPAEGKQLGMWLREAPDITLEQFTGMLRARYKSDVNHGDRPCQWIRWITSYGPGPIDKFKNTAKEVTNGGSGENKPSPTKQRVDANRRALAEIAIQRGWYVPPGTAQPDGETIPESGLNGRSAGIHEGLGAVGPEVLPPGGRGRDSDSPGQS